MSKIALSPNASGTGVFTIASPNGNTDRTLTLPDEAGTIITSGSATVLPKGVPVFRAYMYNGNSNWSFGNSVYTKIPFDTISFDTDSFFDNTTNYRFQPTIAGYYEIILAAYISYSSGSSGTIPLSAIYKNGSMYARGSNISPGGLYASSTVTDIVYLNGSTDYVEGYAYYNTNYSILSPGNERTFISGYLVRAD